jgi:sugar phosphate isomerase/epimerase
MTRRLGVSNLAWSLEHQDTALDLLAECGAQGVEVAPTRLAPWPDIMPQLLVEYRRACAQRGLAVSSLQAIFYGIPEAALLAGEDAFDAMARQVRRVGGIAETLGTTMAVFGAPRSRLRGTMAAEDALDLAVTRFRQLGDIAAEYGLRLGIEPVPPYYGADFLITPTEVTIAVQLCAHPNICVHFDIACATLSGVDPVPALATARPSHFHIAEPDLVALDAPRCDHAGTAAMLAEIDYAGWMVIEMRQDSIDDLAAIRRSVAFARQTYPIQS